MLSQQEHCATGKAAYDALNGGRSEGLGGVEMQSNVMRSGWTCSQHRLEMVQRTACMRYFVDEQYGHVPPGHHLVLVSEGEWTTNSWQVLSKVAVVCKPRTKVP